MRGAVLRLKRGHDRPRAHPWIFKSEVAGVTDAATPGVVTVIDADGHFIGRGFYNPRPTLCCRILTRVEEPLDGDFFRRRLEAAVATRPPASDDSALRLVWSEGDLLPGLIIDRYAEVAVMQCQTLGMAGVRAVVAGALRAVVGDLPIWNADDPVAARLEGFEPIRGWLDHVGPDSVVVSEPGARLSVKFGRGQKTGLYLDQAANRRRVRAWARDREMLDAFSYTGGFACHALLAGARRATCVESSPEAIAGARENFALNGLSERATIVPGNAFDELRRLERSGTRFGLIVLDPPPFARSRSALPAASRGYKEINLRAMRLLEPGGVLLTFSCSHHVSDAIFEDICRDAAADARVTLRVLEPLTQAADHPVLLTVPETRYLTGRVLQAI